MQKILIPENAGIFAIAAEIFRDYAKKLTGFEPEVITQDDGVSDLFVFGNDAEHNFVWELMLRNKIGSLGIRMESDDYAIKSFTLDSRKVLLLAGARKRSLLYAVYDYFEHCGCSYFWDCDILPEKQLPALPMDSFDCKEAPRFDYRGLRYFAHRGLHRFQAEHWDLEDWKREFDWVLKKRMNLVMLRIGMDDLFHKAFPDIVPEDDWKNPHNDTAARSYADRTNFWSAEVRSRLRKDLLQYAFERDLIHPEDTGTMSHWYSMTPKEFLAEVKPDFMPQASQGYANPSGLVWDIRQDKYLDQYFKLTEAHIEHYGGSEPKMFHTIGLAERLCYADRTDNHNLKLYTYRRIVRKLRSKYPHVPLLFASWDFICNWRPEEVQALAAELEPDNTLILDYTSESIDEINNFTNWGIMGKIPWIFGIFHAFEPNTAMCGNYDILLRRIRTAKQDNMCKGFVLWPESSHTDTLMLEYLAANAWDPAEKNADIKQFVETFCTKRYPVKEQYDVLAPLWRDAIPLIASVGWRQNFTMASRGCFFSDYIFNPLKHAMCDLNLQMVENHLHVTRQLNAVIASAAPLLRALAAIPYDSLPEYAKRDYIDLARMAASRISVFASGALVLQIEAWRSGAEKPEHILHYMDLLENMMQHEADLLGVREEYSLHAALERMKQSHPVNPDFEPVLKGNAENAYCRSFVYELFIGCYIPEFRIYRNWIAEKFAANDRNRIDMPKNGFPGEKQNKDTFYTTPLKEYAPDIALLTAKLPETLLALAEDGDRLLADSDRYNGGIAPFFF